MRPRYRLLFDENLPDKLPLYLRDDFPGSLHARDFGLISADDDEIWAVAKREGFTLASKDRDIRDIVMGRGWPPRMVWMRAGNASNAVIADLFRRYQKEIDALHLLEEGSGIFEIPNQPRIQR